MTSKWQTALFWAGLVVAFCVAVFMGSIWFRAGWQAPDPLAFPVTAFIADDSGKLYPVVSGLSLPLHQCIENLPDKGGICYVPLGPYTFDVRVNPNNRVETGWRKR